MLSINFDQELQSKKKFYVRSLGIAILKLQIWVEIQLCSKGERESFYKDRKRGTIRGVTQVVLRVVIGAVKQTCTVLSIHNCCFVFR